MAVTHLVKMLITEWLVTLSEFLLMPFEGFLTGFHSFDEFDLFILFLFALGALAGVVAIIRRFMCLNL